MRTAAAGRRLVGPGSAAVRPHAGRVHPPGVRTSAVHTPPAGGLEAREAARPMTGDILPDEVDFLFCPEALPEEDMHRIMLVVDGVDRPIPTSLVTLAEADAVRLCGHLNRRLGHCERSSWAAFAARILRAGASGGGAAH